MLLHNPTYFLLFLSLQLEHFENSQGFKPEHNLMIGTKSYFKHTDSKVLCFSFDLRLSNY
jgi:hypothetical protein